MSGDNLWSQEKCESGKLYRYGHNTISDNKRCKSISKSGTRCVNARRSGCDTCVRCYYSERNAKAHGKVRYAKVLGPTVKEAVAQHCVGKLDDRASLFDELALMQESIMVDIGLWSQAQEAFKQNPSSEALSLVRTTTSIMQDALAKIKEFKLAAAKIVNDARRSYSITDLGVIVDQLVNIVSSVLDRNSDGEKFESIDGIVLELREQIENELRIPQKQESGQGLAVEATLIQQQYQEMLDSVPIPDSTNKEALQVA